MKPELKVVPLPVVSPIDIAASLRRLANEIEAGDFGEPWNLAWVIDCGGGRLQLGLMGSAGEAGAVAHLLFACACRRLEAIVE